MSEKVKIIVRLSAKARGDSAYETESLWADAVAPGEYRVSNIPLIAYNLNLGDTVRCLKTSDGQLDVQTVIARSGQQTLRLFFGLTATDEQILKVLNVFTGTPAKLEKARRDWWGVSVAGTEAVESAGRQLETFAGDWFGFETGFQPSEPWADIV
jgi:hypothetical protein